MGDIVSNLRPVATALAAALGVASWGLSAGPGQALEQQVCGVRHIDDRGAAMMAARGVSCSAAWKIVKQAYHGLDGSGTARVDGFTCKVSASGAYGAEKGSCKKGSTKISWMIAP